MTEKIVLNDADMRIASRLISLLSCGLTEEQMAEEMNQSLSEFTLLIKGFHEKFGTENLHGLLGTLMLHDGKKGYYSLNPRRILNQIPKH